MGKILFIFIVLQFLMFGVPERKKNALNTGDDFNQVNIKDQKNTAHRSIQQVIQYSSLPQDFQLFARNNDSSAMVKIEGKVLDSGIEAMHLRLFKDNLLVKEDVKRLQGSNASFVFETNINAGLFNYRFEILYETKNQIIIDKTINNVVCGDVILLAGQSNIWAKDYDSKASEPNIFIRTIGSTCAYWNNPVPERVKDKRWYVAQEAEDDTYGAIGVLGMRLGKQLIEELKIPICLINGSGGGGAIKYYQRNDSNPYDLNTIYGRHLYRVEAANALDKVKAIIWNQGESESSSISYKDDFKRLYESWKIDYPNLEKVFLYQIPAGECAPADADKLREVQRQLPEQLNDVHIMSRSGIKGRIQKSNNTSDIDCHYHYEGYQMMAEWIFPLVAHELYKLNFQFNVNPPNISQAFYTKQNPLELCLRFAKWPRHRWMKTSAIRRRLTPWSCSTARNARWRLSPMRARHCFIPVSSTAPRKSPFP